MGRRKSAAGNSFCQSGDMAAFQPNCRACASLEPTSRAIALASLSPVTAHKVSGSHLDFGLLECVVRGVLRSKGLVGANRGPNISSPPRLIEQAIPHGWTSEIVGKGSRRLESPRLLCGKTPFGHRGGTTKPPQRQL